jgi:nucleoid DNA-binding protein
MTQGSRAGREELVSRVQSALSLSTRKEADILVGVVISCLEEELLDHLGDDKFSMKLNSFGKFSVHHRPAIWRKVGFTGETIRTKPQRKVRFVSLGRLRQLEPEEESRELAG